MEYRDFINTNMNDVITALNGSITPAPVNSELYRDFLNRKADDVITALNGSITPAPAGDELYRDFIERKFDDVIAGISGYVPPVTFPTLTGSIVTFNSQYAGLPLKSHKVNIDSVSGVSAISIAHSNRNILPYTLEDIINANGGQATWTDNTKTINGMTFTLNTDSDGKLTSITVKNTATYNTAFYLHSRFTSIYFPASTLYSGVSSAVAGYSARISHSGGQIISSTTTAVAKKTYSNCDIILFFNGGNTFDITVSPRLILSGESDNSYVPHEGKYTTITIGQTVNEGEYDARTGILEVTLPSVQTIQLLPCPIDTTGVGVQNIWADTGDTTLQYIKIGGNI